jgi:hypothetical protein
MAIEKLEVSAVKETVFFGAFITCDEKIISAWKISSVNYLFSGDKEHKIKNWYAKHLKNWIRTKRCELSEKQLFCGIKPKHLDSMHKNAAKMRLNRGIPRLMQRILCKTIKN